ncbi:amidohydrolase [Steroidobacter sp.]|uniref:amidohydrolase n=1 Tax=Steroidobacter sp. TaxID=1978227 RepID=UPI001A3DF4CE|nr:amidohydrolase [Steroidobacter sp.]MBL8268046.1 amidohydrolase [Steroidobacter sp.]
MQTNNSKSKLTLLVGLAMTLALASCAKRKEAVAPADLVVTANGAIYTLDAAKPWVEAVAIADGRYVFVGSRAEAQAFVGPKTQQIEAGDAMVMPGLVDAHVHPLMGGIKALYECNFAFTATPEQVAAALQACAEKTPEGTWIKGGQWGSSFFEQNKLDSPRGFLDRITTRHPIFLNDDSGHNGWVNSEALRIAGINGKTANPEGGTIVKGADKEPNGVLLETAARLFDTVIPSWTDEQYVKAAREATRIANSYGITGIKDAGAFDLATKAFHSLDQTGDLTLHVAACIRTPYGRRTGPLDFDAIEAERKAYRSKHVQTDYVKLFVDGVPTPARTAAMIHPYLADKAHGDHFTGGDMHIDAQQLAADVTELDKRGITVKMHTAGDRSVRAALDAIDAARKANGNSGLRHELAHAGYIDPADIPRFAKLDAVAEFCPILWYPSPIIEAVISAVGEERGRHYWPTRTLLDNKARISTGSDWPAAVPDQNPWGGIEALVTRRDPLGVAPGELWKEEAITLEEALRLYTVNGAEALRLEQQTGSIAVGKSADLIVLDRHLFKIPVEDVGATQVRKTVFEGKVVFDAQSGKE